jgi:hypothetical protein
MVSPLQPEWLLDEAQRLDDVARSYAEAAKKLREVADLLHNARVKQSDVEKLVNAAAQTVAGSADRRAGLGVPDDVRGRIEQLNDILRIRKRPLRRAEFIRSAALAGIPRNTAAAYISAAHFAGSGVV